MNIWNYYSKCSEKIKAQYLILPWDLPTVPGISQKIPPHTSKIKQTWLNQIHSITEIWLYSAILSSNGFLFSSTIVVLNSYFAQHLKKICTYTKVMGRERLDYKGVWELVLAYAHTSAFSQTLCLWVSFEVPTWQFS